MPTAAPALAVTGATGNIGGRVARRLAAAGLAQRLIVRDPARAPPLESADVAQASYWDAEAARRALAGVRHAPVLTVPPALCPPRPGRDP